MLTNCGGFVRSFRITADSQKEEYSSVPFRFRVNLLTGHLVSGALPAGSWLTSMKLGNHSYFHESRSRRPVSFNLGRVHIYLGRPNRVEPNLSLCP
jgi:hypothetical protein